ncbi:MAG: hypothetical protein RLZZ527_182 [Actinomycetota bacterium]|jgi:hypothetical protein
MAIAQDAINQGGCQQDNDGRTGELPKKYSEGIQNKSRGDWIVQIAPLYLHPRRLALFNYPAHTHYDSSTFANITARSLSANRFNRCRLAYPISESDRAEAAS